MARTLEEYCKKDCLVTLFNKVDSDLNGTLSTDELRRALVQIGLRTADVTKIYEQMDTNRDGVISYNEFVRWLFHGSPEAQHIERKVMGGPATPAEAMSEFMEFVQELKDTPPKEGEKPTKLKDIFKKLDDNGSGKVSLTEFVQSCKSLGLDMNDDMLKEVFDLIDAELSKKKKKRKLTEEEQQELIAAAREAQAEDPSVQIPEFFDGHPRGDISCWTQHEKVYYAGPKTKWVTQKKIVYDPHAQKSRDHAITFKEFKQAYNMIMNPA
eukprot:gb/GFBE01080851.1/.p2 GENE.gb/GFBE01080851.1/~~gb/GFBE01080851.1/.p2  ORF type:complete len:268 (-),score=99.64 gb/GFBE01080851.1/:55-858(-)